MNHKSTLAIATIIILASCSTKQSVNGWEEYFCNMEYINNVYLGVLLNNSQLNRGDDYSLNYEFDSEAADALESKYHIKDIAGEGGDFDRALRLMHEFAPRLTHGSDYDNHIAFNALSLLEYSLDKPSKGINCLNKSKVLMELCLSQGIYSRSVSLYPYNPIDDDNHVVVEIYSREQGKWIMLDPSSDTYCQNDKGDPLSLLEIRDCFVSGRPVAILSPEKINDPIYLKTYLTKNLVFLAYDSIYGFGVSAKSITYYATPSNFDIRKWYMTKYPERKGDMENYNYRIISTDSMRENPVR